MQRREVISEVAALKGVPVDKVLAVKVGDVLSNIHDPLFVKIRRGIYATK